MQAIGHCGWAILNSIPCEHIHSSPALCDLSPNFQLVPGENMCLVQLLSHASHSLFWGSTFDA